MISIDTLKSQLQLKYNLIVFDDLASITKSPSAIFKILEFVKKETFDDHERIVFYTSSQPNIKLLNHIDKALSTVDIGKFFFLLCCPEDLTSKLTDYSDKINYLQVNLEQTEDLKDLFHVPDTICPLPWMHLQVRYNGLIYPCCNQSDPIADISKDNLEDTLHGKQMSTLRTAFLAGEKPKACDNCWRTEEKSSESIRTWSTKILFRKFMSTMIDDIKIRSLDIRPSNICNFTCRICSPYDSSAIADEIIKHYDPTINKYEFKESTPLVKWKNSKLDPWTEIEKIMPQIETLAVYGGETFLVKELYSMLANVVNQGHSKNIKLHLHTNGSVYSKNLIDILLEFKEIDLALSVDSIGERFELERGGNWIKVENNLKQIKLNLSGPNINSYVMPVVSILNVLYLDELIAWAESNQFNVLLNFLVIPEYLNINNLTPQAIDLIISKYKNSSNPHLIEVVTRLKNTVGSDGQEFVRQMKHLDTIRNQSLLSTHPEIAVAMGY